MVHEETPLKCVTGEAGSLFLRDICLFTSLFTGQSDEMFRMEVGTGAINQGLDSS